MPTSGAGGTNKDSQRTNKTEMSTTVESTIEAWIGSCCTQEQLDNMREVVYDRVENEKVRESLYELIERKQKSLAAATNEALN